MRGENPAFSGSKSGFCQIGTCARGRYAGSMHNIGIRLVLIVLVSLPLLVAFSVGLLAVQAVEARIE